MLYTSKLNSNIETLFLLSLLKVKFRKITNSISVGTKFGFNISNGVDFHSEPKKKKQLIYK